MTTPEREPAEHTHWQSLRDLLDAMDAEIARLIAGIAGFGLAGPPWLALGCLVVAGAADVVSVTNRPLRRFTVRWEPDAGQLATSVSSAE